MAASTVNVEGSYNQRRTISPVGAAGPKVYFFGGSTMWGSGADDAGTIPSQFAEISGLHAENFGELGWNAHQSIMQLIRLLQDGHRPDLVVFYNGVNDTHQKCRIELPLSAHERERQFDQALRTSLSADSFAHYLAPLRGVAENVKREMSRRLRVTAYDCHSNPQKAEAVANALIDDWRVAKHLVESYGGRFIGLLQPVAYLSKTRLDHVDAGGLPSDKGDQFRAVYPLIRAKLADTPDFHDLVGVLDIDEPFYFDFCHLSPRGNRHIAQRIADLIVPLGLQPAGSDGKSR
jgi:lysophospholipase L1-like esterase